MTTLQWDTTLSYREIIEHLAAGGEMGGFPDEARAGKQLELCVFQALVETLREERQGHTIESAAWFSRTRNFYDRARSGTPGAAILEAIDAEVSPHAQSLRAVMFQPPEGHAWPVDLVESAIFAFIAKTVAGLSLNPRKPFKAALEHTPGGLKAAIAARGLYAHYALEIARACAEVVETRYPRGFTGVSTCIIPRPLLLVSLTHVGFRSVDIFGRVKKSSYVCIGARNSKLHFISPVVVDMVERACQMGAIVGVGLRYRQCPPDIVARVFSGLPVMVFPKSPSISLGSAFAYNTGWSFEHARTIMVGATGHPRDVTNVGMDIERDIHPHVATRALALLFAPLDPASRDRFPPAQGEPAAEMSRDEFLASVMPRRASYKHLVAHNAAQIPVLDSDGPPPPRKRKADAPPAERPRQRRRMDEDAQ